MRLADALAVALGKAGVGDQPLQLRGQRVGVARLEQQPELAVAQRLLVLRQPRDHRHGAARQRPQHQLGRRRDPLDAATAIAARQVLRLDPSAGPAAPPDPQPRGIAGGVAAAGSRSQIVAFQSSSAGSLRSARRNSRSAPRSSSAQ